MAAADKPPMPAPMTTTSYVSSWAAGVAMSTGGVARPAAGEAVSAGDVAHRAAGSCCAAKSEKTLHDRADATKTMTAHRVSRGSHLEKSTGKDSNTAEGRICRIWNMAK